MKHNCHLLVEQHGTRQGRRGCSNSFPRATWGPKRLVEGFVPSSTSEIQADSISGLRGGRRRNSAHFLGPSFAPTSDLWNIAKYVEKVNVGSNISSHCMKVKEMYTHERDSPSSLFLQAGYDTPAPLMSDRKIQTLQLQS